MREFFLDREENIPKNRKTVYIPGLNGTNKNSSLFTKIRDRVIIGKDNGNRVSCLLKNSKRFNCVTLLII